MRFFALLLLIAGPSFAFAQPTVLKVWPGKVPGEKEAIGEEKTLEQKPGEKKVQRLTNVSIPTLSVYRPAKEKDTGAAVIVCPGGGYNILAWDLEGEEVAQWLNSIGITGIVLKYRVPRRADDAKDKAPAGAFQDGQRAVSLVRSKAKEMNIDPDRIGMLGFSAGGNLAVRVATGFDKRTYEAIDDVDQVSCKPNFAVLVYPGGIVNKDRTELLSDIAIHKNVPPLFLVHAANDPVPCENSILLFLAARGAEVPAELHVYATGGHGFGLRPSTDPVSTWPQRCADWMKKSGWLQAK
ncbi:MAG: alpha/beta hydrolase [Gemmataceae bacterium]|nr:alpha/beta hydrolase [Gemmataceae bacterium]